MSKASVKASIESVKGDIERVKISIAKIRSQKSEANARYAAHIKNASSRSSKVYYRERKASVIASYEREIRSEQGR